MQAICRNCPGMMTGDCTHCDVLREEVERDDHEIDSFDPFYGEPDKLGGEREEVRND